MYWCREVVEKEMGLFPTAAALSNNARKEKSTILIHLGLILRRRKAFIYLSLIARVVELVDTHA